MGKTKNIKAFQKDIAKHLGLKPEEIEVVQAMRTVNICSPTFALLLCSAHNQDILNMNEIDGKFYAEFVQNEVFKKAEGLWKHVTDEYKNGEPMEIAHLLDHYLRHFMSVENAKHLNNMHAGGSCGIK